VDYTTSLSRRRHLVPFQVTQGLDGLSLHLTHYLAQADKKIVSYKTIHMAPRNCTGSPKPTAVVGKKQSSLVFNTAIINTNMKQKHHITLTFWGQVTSSVSQYMVYHRWSWSIVICGITAKCIYSRPYTFSVLLIFGF